MDANQLRNLIKQTLTPLNLYSANAEQLLLATAANESHLGEYRKQINGPALGIFQEDPDDYADIYKNYLAYHPTLQEQVNSLSKTCTFQDLEYNDAYAVAVCRVHYLRAPGELPDANDIDGIWDYYKRYYNSALGAANKETFIECFNRFIVNS
jgi:hypothetical protein